MTGESWDLTVRATHALPSHRPPVRLLPGGAERGSRPQRSIKSHALKQNKAKRERWGRAGGRGGVGGGGFGGPFAPRCISRCRHFQRCLPDCLELALGIAKRIRGGVQSDLTRVEMMIADGLTGKATWSRAFVLGPIKLRAACHPRSSPCPNFVHIKALVPGLAPGHVELRVSDGIRNAQRPAARLQLN
ncbi:hypothetical protein Q8A73_023190 [Channa argus]|nr:hypothetical protein Q8A73_023190 [Channa argus]